MLAIGLTLALRLGLGIVMGAAWAVARPTVAGLVPAGTYGELSMPESPFGELALGVWVRWDAVQHLNLALRGYLDMGQGSTVFFPLYAGLTGGLGRLLGGNYILAGLTVSTLATALALLLLIQLGADLFGPSSGRWAAVALAVYPTAVFLIAPFTESLFLALTLGAFLAAYRARWILTAILAFMASLTRGPGMAAAASFAILGWWQWKHGLPSRTSSVAARYRRGGTGPACRGSCIPGMEIVRRLSALARCPERICRDFRCRPSERSGACDRTVDPRARPAHDDGPSLRLRLPGDHGGDGHPGALATPGAAGVHGI